jgi:hypothetical protein
MYEGEGTGQGKVGVTCFTQLALVSRGAHAREAVQAVHALHAVLAWLARAIVRV